MRRSPLYGRFLSAWSLPPAVVAGLITAVAGLTTAAAHAQHQSERATPPGRLIALHYEDRLASELHELQVSVPLPSVATDRVDYRSDCLDAAGSVEIPDHRSPLVLELKSPPYSAEWGVSCRSVLALSFMSGQRSWAATAEITVTQVPDLPELGYEQVSTTFMTDRLAIPRHLQPPYITTVALLKVINLTVKPMTLLGFGNTPDLISVIGPVYIYDPNSFSGTHESLLTGAQPLKPSSIAPGEELNMAIVYDPDQRLPGAAGAITVRPIALVMLDGQRFALPFPRGSVSWAAEPQ